jgi:hypothetical protein
MHDKAVAASSAPGDIAGRYLPYESADLYDDLRFAAVTRKAGGYYLTEPTLERRLLRYDPSRPRMRRVAS